MVVSTRGSDAETHRRASARTASKEDRVETLLETYRGPLKEMRAKLAPRLAPRHTDTWMLRYLINSSVDKAIRRFDDMLTWRDTYNVDEIEDKIRLHNMQPNQFPYADAVTSFFPQLINHSESIDGMPVSFEFYGKSNVVALMKTLNHEQFAEYCRYKVEYLRIRLERYAREEGLFKRVVVVADLSGLGMKHLHVPFLSCLKSVSKFMEDYYREQVGRVVCMNSNNVFTMCWKFIRPALNQQTVEKVDILGSKDSVKALAAIAHPADIPVMMGGTCTCDYCTPVVVNQTRRQTSFGRATRPGPYTPTGGRACPVGHGSLASSSRPSRLFKMVKTTVKKPFSITGSIINSIGRSPTLALARSPNRDSSGSESQSPTWRPIPSLQPASSDSSIDNRRPTV